MIGQLWGGPDLNCANPAGDYADYGKFNISWTGDGSTDPRRRLSNWLDLEGFDVQSLDGYSGSSYMIKVNGIIYQPDCNSFSYTGVPFDNWGGAYDVCGKTEISVRFKSNKNNLTCVPVAGAGTYYLYNFSNGTYELQCTFEKGIYEFGFTDGNTTEYIAFRAKSDLYSILQDPASNKINIEFNKESIEKERIITLYVIYLYDQTGFLETSVTSKGENISINTSNLSRGFYLLHVVDSKGNKIGVEKILISH